MRSSPATLLLVATIAATTCIHTGCRLGGFGKTASVPSFSRPRLLARKDKDKPATSVASTTPKPPASSIPPSGTSVAASGSASSSVPGPSARSFPSEPAPSSYASTNVGSGDYAPRGSDSHGGDSYGGSSRDGGYAAPSGRDDGYAATSGSGSQRGFYDTEYQGGGSPASQSGGYDNYSNTGGAQADYGQSYAGSGGRDQGYQQVADRRGDTDGDSYNDQGYRSSPHDDGSQYAAPSSYGNDPRYASSSGSTYGAHADSPAVSGSGANYDDYQSPAADSYDDSYSSGSYNSGSSYGAGATASAGADYNSTYGAGDNYGSGSGSAGVGANAAGANASTAGATPASWRPGSTGRTEPYGQKPLSPPTTNSGW